MTSLGMRAFDFEANEGNLKEGQLTFQDVESV